MIINKTYYLLKPILPRPVRIALRQARAARRRRTFADVWPIDPSAGATPPGWPGWPEGKRFGVVLTHDVEGSAGLARVRQLAELEDRHGFRSSFNFVPKGEYQVPESLQGWLRERNFEIGVHGLEHDGHLYDSKRRFAAKAVEIREQLRRWGAEGFRSPLMQHRLGWQHLLGAGYDASSFDTDPFEPESDGFATIFPFWVPGPDGHGFVELPYTLVQDFNLYVVLAERTNELWKRKAEWIAERGGMVLLNTHPDYMCFEGRPGAGEYPVSHYGEFLEWLRRRYGGDAFWTGTARELAAHYRSALPAESRNTRRRICMVTHSFYEEDNRVRRYAEALASRGDLVDVLAIGHGDGPLIAETIRGVRVRRLQRRVRDERTRWAYAFRLVRFTVRAARALTRLHRRVRYDVVHIHNIPDFLVFAAWYPKWTGARVILDIHDLVPEYFANKFRSSESGFSVAAMKWVERAAARFADHVIIANHLWRDRIVARSANPEKCSVYLNHVDTAVFYPRARTRQDGRFVIIFPGSFGWHQGLDIGIEAFARIRERVPHAEFHIYGNGNREPLVRLCERLGLGEKVKFFNGVTLDEIAGVVANADLGIVPKRADSFGNEAYSTKIMEFMSQGVPVVVSRTKIDTYYFTDREVQFFASGDSAAMADAMLAVIGDPARRAALVEAGREYVKRNNWDTRRQDYLRLVDHLATEHFPGIATEPPAGEASTVQASRHAI